MSIYFAAILIIIQSNSLNSRDEFGCPSDPKFRQAEYKLTKARNELNSKKYIEADSTIKQAITELGIAEDAPRCRDCNDDTGLYFLSMVYAEKMGDFKYAAEARYDDFDELIQLYTMKKCHVSDKYYRQDVHFIHLK